VAASGAVSARLAARIGDGLIGLEPDAKLIGEFARHGGERKPRYGQLHLCYGPSEDAARRRALEHWPNTALPGRLFSELKTTEHFEEALQLVREEDMASVLCGPDPEPVLEAIEEYRRAGYDHLALHQIGPNQEEFLGFFESELSKKLEARGAPEARRRPRQGET
jgi:G6PDH family F420-dependent oxidoreductase